MGVMFCGIYGCAHRGPEEKGHAGILLLEHPRGTLTRGSGWQEYAGTRGPSTPIYRGTPCTLVYRRPQFLVVGVP